MCEKVCNVCNLSDSNNHNLPTCACCTWVIKISWIYYNIIDFYWDCFTEKLILVYVKSVTWLQVGTVSSSSPPTNSCTRELQSSSLISFKWSHRTDQCRRHIVALHCYLRRLDTARWSRKVHPWTWWTVDPGTPKRRQRRRPQRGPSGPALPGATLRKHSHIHNQC